MNEKNSTSSKKQPKTPSVPNRAHTEMKKQNPEQKIGGEAKKGEKKENKYE